MGAPSRVFTYSPFEPRRFNKSCHTGRESRAHFFLVGGGGEDQCNQLTFFPIPVPKLCNARRKKKVHHAGCCTYSHHHNPRTPSQPRKYGQCHQMLKGPRSKHDPSTSPSPGHQQHTFYSLRTSRPQSPAGSASSSSSRPPARSASSCGPSSSAPCRRGAHGGCPPASAGGP